MSRKLTLFDKLWQDHEILCDSFGRSLLWVDRHFVHEGSHHAFWNLKERGISVREPTLTFGVVDHYAPTQTRWRQAGRRQLPQMIQTLMENTNYHGIECFDLQDSRQGIVHVIGPEQGLTLPGLLINCGDSHTSTHGAFGALAFGIGATEVAHVLATQTIWQTRPKQMRVTVKGELSSGVGAKDLALALIAKIGADGARGHALEYAGAAVRALSMEARMTLCNLSIESGARYGMIAPDQTTFDYIKDRPNAPQGADWDAAQEYWLSLASDENASFDCEIELDAAEIAPTVTWGISPEDALPIYKSVPDPETKPKEKAAKIRAALDYMGLNPGTSLDGLAIDQVFIGSCTNARIEDLREAAAILRGRTAKVPGMVVPGSNLVKQQAEQEGLAQVFMDAGLEWAEPSCSMCVGMNGDQVASGKRCASTSNRNFKGRQGPGARTHLMSPAMVAAAAVTGAITDVRPLLKGREQR